MGNFDKNGNYYFQSEGINVSRRDAIDALMNSGYSRRDARRAIRDVRRNIRSNGGEDARQSAYDWAYAKGNEVTPEVKLLNTPTTFTPSVVLSSPVEFVDLKRPEPQQERQLSFNEAFRNARKSGLDMFEWNGNKYNTRLSDSRSYVENAIDAMGPYGDQSRPYWEVAAMGLSKK